MRMAWPERIVLIVVVTLAILGAEIAVLIAAKENRVAGWIVAAIVLIALLLDLWAILRLIDWLSAGPARRKKERIVKFSP